MAFHTKPSRQHTIRRSIRWLILISISALAVIETLDKIDGISGGANTNRNDATGLQISRGKEKEGSVTKQRYLCLYQQHRDSSKTQTVPSDTSNNHLLSAYNKDNSALANSNPQCYTSEGGDSLTNESQEFNLLDWARSSMWSCLTHLKSLLPKPIVITAYAIRLIRIEAPTTVQAGQPIRLRCLLEATKGDRLQSLSWYKNGREFYRYQPYDRIRPVLTFNLVGVNLDLSKSKNNTVLLVNTTIETSGRFKCEVTGTTFQEEHKETYISVAAASSCAVSFVYLTASTYLLVASLTYISTLSNSKTLIKMNK